VQHAVDLPVAGAGEPVPELGRTWSPEEASMGAVPFQDAKCALVGNRVSAYCLMCRSPYDVTCRSVSAS